ncbi:MAG: hypothetical protein K2P41_02360 [Lachnospiraceae bacterium]|nr:hypothetical protein [Lachnospiraceae bacterium]
MEFSEFANTLWGILAKGSNVALFTRELFKRITDIPDDVDPNPIDDPGDPTFKAYFTGDRRLTRFAPKIASYVDAELFVSYIHGISSDAQELIYQQLKDQCPHMTRANIPEETAYLFRDILFSFAKKNFSPKKKKAALAAQDIGKNEPVKHEDFPLLQECNMRCPLCRDKLVKTVKGHPLKKYEVVPLFPAWLDLIQQNSFKAVAPPPNDLDSLDNKILLCRDCAGEYLVAPSAAEYRRLLLIKKQQRDDILLQDKVDDIAVEKGIRQILDAIADIKKTPKPIDRTKWEAFRVDKKIPDDNGLLQDRVTYWVLRYYRYIEMQFKQGERTSLLRFKKVQNEVSQCFETFDEANMPQREIFERLVKWLEDQTDCHNRDAQEAMISFFVQNCEVFNETPE